MSGLIDLPTIKEPSVFVQNVPTQEDRDFSYPKVTRQSTMPKDINQTDDSSGAVLQVQKFMKTSPYGIVYNGPTDGSPNPEFLAAVTKWEDTVEFKYPGHSLKGLVLQNNNISRDGLKKFIEVFKDVKSKKPTQSSNFNIQAFQKFFNQPETGIVDPQLISAAKSVEALISKHVGSSASGMLFDDSTKQFKTTVEDLNSALKLINKPFI